MLLQPPTCKHRAQTVEIANLSELAVQIVPTFDAANLHRVNCFSRALPCHGISPLGTAGLRACSVVIFDFGMQLKLGGKGPGMQEVFLKSTLFKCY